MAISAPRWLNRRRTTIEHAIDAELAKLAPVLTPLLERHGADIAHVVHRLVRVAIETAIIRLVIKLAQRHPVTAITVALIGLEAIDEFAQREASRIADWMVTRFVRIGATRTAADTAFLAASGIDPNDTDPFQLPWTA